MDHVEKYYHNKKFKEDDLKLFNKLDQERKRFNKLKKYSIYISISLVIGFLYFTGSKRSEYEILSLMFTDFVDVISTLLLIYLFYKMLTMLVIHIHNSDLAKNGNNIKHVTDYQYMIKRYYIFLEELSKINMKFILLSLAILLFLYFNIDESIS